MLSLRTTLTACAVAAAVATVAAPAQAMPVRDSATLAASGTRCSAMSPIAGTHFKTQVCVHAKDTTKPAGKQVTVSYVFVNTGSRAGTAAAVSTLTQYSANAVSTSTSPTTKATVPASGKVTKAPRWELILGATAHPTIKTVVKALSADGQGQRSITVSVRVP